MDKRKLIKYRAILNPTITEWENADPLLSEQLRVVYEKLVVGNCLNPNEYKPVLRWDYVNDDFAKNRITLILEAQPILDEVVIPDNYKIILDEVDSVFTIKNDNA